MECRAGEAVLMTGIKQYPMFARGSNIDGRREVLWVALAQ